MSDTAIQEQQPAPDFTLPAVGSDDVVNNGQVHLADLKGKTVVLYFYPKDPMSSIDAEEELERSKIILWKGYCTTHMRFNLQQIAKARSEYPGIKILVHPECRREVVEAADLYGSTEYIIQQIEKAPAGSQWAVATEINLVHRLAKEHPEQFIFCLDPIVCPCSTMYRIHPAYLAWVLEGLVQDQVINQVSVDEEIAHWARVALERMLSL